MHKYMRAIGFSKITDRKELQKLITGGHFRMRMREPYTSSMEDDTGKILHGISVQENLLKKDLDIYKAVCGEFDSTINFLLIIFLI